MKLTKIILLIFSLVLCLGLLCACIEEQPENDQPVHTHTAGEAVVENKIDATCTAEGSYDEVVYCTECEAEISRVAKVIDKVAHTAGEAVVENEIDATCSAEGSYDEVVYCTECEAEISRVAKVIDKVAHTAGEAVVENEIDATCTEEGSYDEVVYCTECEAEMSRVGKVIDKVAHTAGEAVVENKIDATCTAEGSYDEVVYCTECEAEMSRESKTLEITEHHYVDGVCECGDKYVSVGLDFGLVNGDAEYAVTGMGTCTDTDVYVPSEYEGKPVTEIAEEAFKDNAIIHTISLPETIKKVGDKAFSGCEALVEVTMSDFVEIGKDVFRGSINVEIAVIHVLTYVPEKAATCEEAGNKEHYYCATCNEYYSDENGENEIFDAIIPAAHHFVDGVCTNCSTILASVKIVSVDSVPYLGKFALGTLESAIGLPAEIYVTTGDGARHLLPVSWDLTTYDKTKAGEYVIKGHIQAGMLHFGDGVSSAIEAGIEIVEYMKGTADIVFVLDISGSMSSPITNVKNNLVAFANAIDAAGVSARYSIVTYSDWTYSSNAKEQSQIVKNGASDWYITAEEAKVAINGISLASGGDLPETAVDGIMLAKTMLSTRQDSRVFYVLLTDDTNKINNHYGVSSMEECGKILADAGINLSVICPTTLYSYYSPFTSVTGGASLNISGNFGSSLSNTLIPIIQSGVEN